MDIRFFVSIIVSLAIIVVAIDNVPIAKDFVATTFDEAGANIGNFQFKVPSLGSTTGAASMPIEIALESFEPSNVSMSSKASEIRMVDAHDVRIVVDNKEIALTPTLAGSVLILGFDGSVSFDTATGAFSFNGKANAINSDIFSLTSDRQFQAVGSATSEAVQLSGLSVNKLRFEKTTGAITYNKTNSIWLANTIEVFNFAGNMTLGDGAVMKGSVSSFDMVGDKARVSIKA